MRATISFNTDVAKVNNIMHSLVSQEVVTIAEALDCLEASSPDKLTEGIGGALEHLYEAARQLEQYKEMVVAFERARYETMLPQPASQPNQAEVPDISSFADVREAAQNMEEFDSFLSRITDDKSEDSDSEATNESEEG